MKIEGCIFDMDGTLLDTMPLWGRVGRDYIIRQGKEPKPDIEERLRAMTMRQVADYFISDYGVKKEPDEIGQGINDIMEENYKMRAFPKEGVIDFLEYMMKKGVKMCVASATDKYLIEYALKANDMEKYFSAVYSCTDVGASKEHPNIYDIALKALGTSKEYTYVFEDAYHAIKTLRKNDFKIVGIYDNASKDQEEIIKEASDIFIHSFKELKEIF